MRTEAACLALLLAAPALAQVRVIIPSVFSPVPAGWVAIVRDNPAFRDPQVQELAVPVLMSLEADKITPEAFNGFDAAVQDQFVGAAKAGGVGLIDAEAASLSDRAAALRPGDPKGLEISAKLLVLNERWSGVLREKRRDASREAQQRALASLPEAKRKSLELSFKAQRMARDFDVDKLAQAGDAVAAAGPDEGSEARQRSKLSPYEVRFRGQTFPALQVLDRAGRRRMVERLIALADVSIILSQEDQMTPEIRKLLERKRAAGLVVKTLDGMQSGNSFVIIDGQAVFAASDGYHEHPPRGYENMELTLDPARVRRYRRFFARETGS